jgi:hypothetical protein
MSDYTKSTNFASKDNLTSGNPLKIVKGTEIDTEFNNIQTAIATKADLVSPTFTGSPVLPTGTTGVTQSSSDDTTKLATTAFVQDVADVVKSALFPVGAIYTATVSTNPATLIGFGTWTAFGAGRVLIGNGGGFSAGATGGSADAVVVSHTHTGTTNSSNPTAAGRMDGVSLGFGTPSNYPMPTNVTVGSPVPWNPLNAHTHTFTTDSSGVSGTNANLPPYIVVYMWQRTA